MSTSHTDAANIYADKAKAGAASQRELEAQILLKANRKFEDLQKNWEQASMEELDDALTYNKRLWWVFVDNAVDSGSSDGQKKIEDDTLRKNIANLGIFVFKRTLDIQGEQDKSKKKDKLSILIEVNKEIAAGLLNLPQSQLPHPKPDDTDDKTTENGDPKAAESDSPKDQNNPPKPS